MSINDGLISLYNFNGNARDGGGGGFHGTVNGATLTTDIFGNANSAYAFSGANQYITIPDSAIPGTFPITIECIAKTNAVLTTNDTIVHVGARSNNQSYGIAFGGSLDQQKIMVYAWGQPNVYADTTYTIGQAYHIVLTISAGKVASLFINGVKQTSTQTYPSLAPTGTLRELGRLGLNDTYALNGSIYGVSVWNRVLSDAEIMTLATVGRGNHSILSTGEYLTHSVSNIGVDSTGLALLLNMNGNARDGSGNHYHGTVTGATLTTDQLGNANSAYSFNGTSNYISLGDILDVGLGDLSYSLWFNTSTVGGGFVGLLNKSRAAGANGRYGTMFTGGELYSFIDFDTAANIWKVSIPQTPFIDGNWHNLTVTMKRTGNLTMYVDGINKGVVDISAHVATDCSATDLLGIGAYQNSTGTAFTQGFFNGKIADVRMYSRELSALEALQLYNTGLGKISRIKGKTYTKGFNTNTPPTTPIKLSQKKGSLISSSLITL